MAKNVKRKEFKNKVLDKDGDLEKEGWTRQFSAAEPRLSEAVELYKEIGFEVRLEPLDRKEAGECGVCFEEDADKYKIIYTRKKK